MELGGGSVWCKAWDVCVCVCVSASVFVFVCVRACTCLVYFLS